MKAFFIFIGMLTVLNAWGQKKDFGLPPTDLRAGSLHQGDLFTIKMIPGDHETSFYIVGKKTGTFKVDKMKMDITFESGGEKKHLTLNRKEQAFIFPKKVDKDLDLELKSEIPGEVDRLHIRVKP